ncbi:hypothetical protein [Streptomyces racemochromogenes]|uniref:hypothetical protein n=1 Tax=Streptomyces racemochromogenes TaxID=67353 RepID=UPI0031E8A4E2
MTPIQAPAVALREDRFPAELTVLVSGEGVHYPGSPWKNQVDPLFGVVWEKWAGPCTGAPLYGEFDPAVQRVAADRLLCAMGGERPEVLPGEGMLWLLQTDEVAHQWPATILTVTPPICLPHAQTALSRCAVLRRGHLAVRVPEAEPVGVIGTLYTPEGPQGGADQLVLFTDTSRLPFVLARHLVLELRGAVPDRTLHPESLPSPALRALTPRLT